MKVLFVSSGSNNAQTGSIVKLQAASLLNFSIEIEFFPIVKKGITGYLKESMRLRRSLKKNKFSIIYAHYGLSGIVSLLARKNEKLVVSFMGDDLLGTNRPDGKVTGASKVLARLNSWLASKYYDYSICKSKEMMAILDNANANLIPNGVDIELFKPDLKTSARRKLDIDCSSKIAIFVSNPARNEKNFELAVKALRASGIDSFKLLTVTGVSPDCLSDYYNAADVLVLSSYHEGSPNVIKEAMACNCPIVSTNVGDVKWVIGETAGCYLASFDPEDFAEKLRMALEFSKNKGRTYGRERIIKLGLNSESVAKKIIEVYNLVLSK